MAWLRVDDRFRTHPKVQKAGLAGWLAFCGISYCREHLTDGVIPREAVKSLAPGLPTPMKHAAKLVAVGLWHEHPDGFLVHDFTDWNPTKEEVEVLRDWGTRRKSVYRDKDLTRFIRERDQDRCRYCGRAVNWNDRRGPCGGQQDHVVPRGDNSPDNIVVSCRECNIRKGSRTPQEAGMTLRAVPIPELVPNRDESSSPRERASGGAGDAGLGSLSGSGSGELQTEESARETEALSVIPPKWGRMGNGSAHRADTLVGDHRRCLPCAADACNRGLCVPGFLAQQWLQQLGRDPDAESQVREFVGRVLSRISGVVGDDPLKFWRSEWAAEHGTQARASGQQSRGAQNVNAAAKGAENFENRRHKLPS